jgi:hypothetical protein
VGLTETHIDKQSERNEKLELLLKTFANWTCICSSFSSSKVGTALLIHPELKVEASGFSEDGRLAWATICGVKIVLTYFPTNIRKRTSFIQDVLTPVMDPNFSMILLGDHNMVLSEEDKDGKFKVSQDILTMKALLYNNDLLDAASVTNDTTRTYLSSHGTKSRIDHFFLSEELVDNIELETIPMPRPFDHACLILSWKQIERRRKTRWIMNATALTQLDQIIKDRINLDLSDITSPKWHSFKQHIRECLKEATAGSTKKKRNKLNELQAQLDGLWKGDIVDNSEYQKVSAEMFELEIQECEAQALRARVHFDRSIDAPTAAFTNFIKGRQTENTLRLKKSSGEFTEEAKEVAALLASHLNHVHRSRESDLNPTFTRHIPRAQNELGADITTEEVLLAIKKLRPRSSPGSDGFVPEFYQRYKDKLAPVLAQLYNKILSGHPQPVDFKVALIRFIKKKNFDNTAKTCRPISLLNCDMKILTSVLAERLQSVLPHMTENLAYIRERFIIQHVLNLDALFKTETSAKFTLLTDFIAAFDSLSHSWIQNVVERAGLGEHFAKAIKFLLTGMEAYPLIDAAPVFDTRIVLSAGVRQGDPLSGPLFVLCVEPLIRAVRQFLTHDTFAYADDLAFCTANEINLTNVIRMIKAFSSTSGLELSICKSKVCEIRNSSRTGHSIEGISFVADFEYLGYSFSENGINDSFLIKKMDEIVEKLNDIKKQNLSTIQKVVVLNVYIFSSLYYFLWASSPTKPFYKYCDQVSRWFLGVKKERFDPSKSYPLFLPLSTFNKPKIFGGFGLVNIQAKTFSFKWRLFMRYKLIDSPFRDYIYSSLLDIQPKKKFVLALNRTPKNASNWAKDLIQASKLLKPTFSAKNVDDLFMESSIQLPQSANFKGGPAENSECKEVAARILNSSKPFEELREGQKKLLACYPTLDYGVIWKDFSVFKTLRPAIRSFCIKLFNAGIFLPDDCPLCKVRIHSCTTQHFLACSQTKLAMTSLCPNATIDECIQKPACTYKTAPNFPLVLYAVYCVAMGIVYNRENVTHVDFIPRVKMKLKDEIRRKNYKWF